MTEKEHLKDSGSRAEGFRNALSSSHPHTQGWGALNTWTVLDLGQDELGYACHNYSPLSGGLLQRRWPG